MSPCRSRRNPRILRPWVLQAIHAGYQPGFLVGQGGWTILTATASWLPYLVNHLLLQFSVDSCVDPSHLELLLPRRKSVFRQTEHVIAGGTSTWEGVLPAKLPSSSTSAPPGSDITCKTECLS